MDSTTKAFVVLTTFETEDQAREVVSKLVEARLVACGTLIPGVRSIYRWEGDVRDDREALVLMKTRGDLLDALREQLSVLHPYDVPEFVALESGMTSQAYLEWIREETVGE